MTFRWPTLSNTKPCGPSWQTTGKNSSKYIMGVKPNLCINPVKISGLCWTNKCSRLYGSRLHPNAQEWLMLGFAFTPCINCTCLYTGQYTCHNASLSSDVKSTILIKRHFCDQVTLHSRLVFCVIESASIFSYTNQLIFT